MPAKPGRRRFRLCLDPGTQDVVEGYRLGEEIGHGRFGKIRVAVNIKTGKKFACKSILRREIKRRGVIDDIENEIQIMHHLSGHPNIVSIHGAFKDRYYVHLVMEYCSGGKLLDRIVERGRYTEADAADLIRTILRVVQHCHDMGVVHRDLKPENFVFLGEGKGSRLKAIDFGSSAFFDEGQVFHDFVGTPFYMAPEVILGSYGKEVDVWSAGVILYILLSGVPPFYGESEREIRDAILQGDVDFESEPWPRVSEQAKDAVRRMLVQDPRSRATAEDILCHEWVREDGVDFLGTLTHPVLWRIREFAAMNNLRKEAVRIVAAHMPTEEIEGLRHMFCALDSDRNGMITYEELGQGLKRKGALVPEAELRRLIRDIDLDGDGVLNYEEFLAATVNLAALRDDDRAVDDRLMAAFEHFDVEGTGYLTREELLEALGESGDEDTVSEILSEVDTDHDGRIDYGDFCKLVLGPRVGVGGVVDLRSNNSSSSEGA
eukprot:evm.model.scf_390.4 EVM.evm.TU.scf_390.4   scf_390:79168-83187(+)